ncbi:MULTISPECIES: ankyrin repeat domain-containing protein [unclassified Spiroplasma]|uniref:ankyrin repeat domain-containing protein n=1 Tax=unclassified Spiroplasma TaxID=2637901 RepID=UPI00313B589D
MLPELLEKKLLKNIIEVKSYCNYSVAELKTLKGELINLQEELDCYRAKETVVFIQKTLISDLSKEIRLEIDKNGAWMQELTNQKEKLTNYIDRIDYRMKALTINYREEQQKQIFNDLEQLINGADISAIKQFLENTPMDLNINSPMFIFKKVGENRFQKIDFHKSLEVLEILINYGFNSNFLNEYGYASLHIAVKSGCVKRIQLLLDNGANINFLNSIGNAPLYCAVKSKNIEAIQLLLDNGANINILNSRGATPLYCAVEDKVIGAIELLLKWGADVNIKTRFNESCLFVAVLSKNVALAQLLLDNGADINILNTQNETPLFYAVKIENIELVKLLLDQGADINIQNRARRTPLFYAEKNKSIKVIELLLERGAK